MLDSPIKDVLLLMWKGTAVNVESVENIAPVLRNVFSDLTVQKTSKYFAITIPSIEFIFEVNSKMESRGVIYQSEIDAEKIAVLFAISRVTPLVIINDDQVQISSFRFVEGLKHFQFHSKTFQEFVGIANNLGILEKKPDMQISGFQEATFL